MSNRYKTCKILQKRMVSPRWMGLYVLRVIICRHLRKFLFSILLTLSFASMPFE